MCSPGRSSPEQVLAELAAADPCGLPAAALMEQMTGLAAFIGQLQGELGRRAAALEASGGMEDYGHASVAAFLRTGCALAPRRAGEIVAAGRGLRRQLATEKALAAGEISFDQALVTVRTATAIQDPPSQTARLSTADMPDPSDAAEPGTQAAAQAAAEAAERILLDAAAGGATVAQLRRLGEEATYRADPDAAEERERRRFERRYLSFGLTLGGTGTLSGACGDALTFEVICTAAEAFGPPGGQFDTRTAAQRRLDGLAAACRTALDTGTATIRHGAAPHISVLVHDHTLAQAGGAQAGGAQAGGAQAGGAQAGGAQAGGAQAVPGFARGAPPARTGHGQMLTGAQVLSLCCGADITAIRWSDGLPLDVGRASRTEPPALRKAIEARDRTCRWPGCEAPGVWATAHHIGGWAHGAKTSLGQLALLCHLHHAYFIHLRGWTITGDPNGTLHFTHPNGNTTLHSPLPGKGFPPGKPRAP